MWAEQAIFTSLSRQGRSGYHVVARSPGVTDAEASSLATWSPSHGALLVDELNRTSVNFHPLASGRYALSRTCQGAPEYSGRGGRQVYTHALIVDPNTLKKAGNNPFAIYHDALALGYFLHRAEPDTQLKCVPLSFTHPRLDPAACADRARELGLPDLETTKAQLVAGRSVALPHAGDRIALAECLLGQLPADMLGALSFSTSLQPSAVRPFRLLLVGTA
ncbi:MAG: hypothetical protein P4L84_03915 [Isosphaeraceae bacterium]|nr:hypothetical protein [Isosphaeraceae bacterium]